MDLKNKLTTQAKRFDDFVYGQTEIGDSLIERFRNYLVERLIISDKEKSLFFNLFSVLVNAGVPTIRSLLILKQRTENQKFFRVLSTIHFDVERGSSLSQAMSKFPDVFTGAELGVIETGEATGGMENALARLGFQSERKNKVKQDLKSALVYPLMIGLVLLVSAVVMVTFVIPELRSLYDENGLELTGLTSVLINGSSIISKYWLVIVALIAAAWTAFKIYIGNQSGKIKWDAFLLDLPYLGEVIRKYNIAEFTSTLGIMIESGIPIQKALRTVNKSTQNSLYRLKTFELIGRVQTGEKISAILMEAPWLFPGNVTQILEIGEQSATLGDLSLKVAKQYDDELRYSLKNLNSVVGPVVIIIVAVFVVLFALAILLPIFNLTQNVAV